MDFIKPTERWHLTTIIRLSGANAMYLKAQFHAARNQLFLFLSVVLKVIVNQILTLKNQLYNYDDLENQLRVFMKHLETCLIKVTVSPFRFFTFFTTAAHHSESS